MKLFYSDKNLYKVEDFKGLNYSKTNFDICDKLEDKDWKQFLDDNQEFRNLLIKLGFFIFGDDYYIEDDMFCDFKIFLEILNMSNYFIDHSFRIYSSFLISYLI
jgi:hypothetical protein